MPSIANNGAHVTVCYPTKEAQQNITKAEYELIRMLSDRKVTAIKFIRAQYALGLYEAKQIVDAVCDQPAVYGNY